MVCPFHTSFAEPHLSLLSIGETVCRASGGLSDGEPGMGGKDGIGEGSEGRIYRSSGNEGGSKGIVRRKIKLGAKGGVEEIAKFAE